jgi:galactokinase
MINDLAPDLHAREMLARAALQTNLRVKGGTIRRTSSRFCLGVEHGDYNGTELFGVGTDRFIWLAAAPNGTNRIRLFSANFPESGIVDFPLGHVPPPRSAAIANTWARFPNGVDHVLRREGFQLTRGFDGVLYGNIPGGGMSRSASLCINLLLTFLDVNASVLPDGTKIVDMAQAIENDYIGSPCGKLDPLMIHFARAGMGTHYNPNDGVVRHVALGRHSVDFRFVCLDTGTVRPGLEKSTYKIRRAECEQFVALAGKEFGVSHLGDIRDQALYDRIIAQYAVSYPHLCRRLKYIFNAQQRFDKMLDAWKSGDIQTVGAMFRQDGIGLRDDYQISGAELDTMCEIARTVPGVLGERMLGGGDKGAAGALVGTESVNALKTAVDAAYPRCYPHLTDKYAVHVCHTVDGVAVQKGL